MNILKTEKQVAVIAGLTEGLSIRSVERMTGIHRDTIMRLGVRVGEACGEYMNKSFRDLVCNHIEIDEIWGFVGKKQNRLTDQDNPREKGDVYTFVSLDKATKLVPSFHVGQRTGYDAQIFIDDLSGRVQNRIQLSSDAFNAYVDAVERGFGCEIDYGQIVKVYDSADLPERSRKYSPARICSSNRVVITGSPKEKICTSHIESQNLTMRMHCRRLTRLTNAFSKKIENFKSAVALHFGYYNLVKTHKTLRTTPAMAAGVSDKLWTVEDLVNLCA